MKLNMGCGYNRLDGWVNVDVSPVCGPDQVVDLEQFPWPWDEGLAQQVLFNHSLEHLGQQTDVFLGIMRELYRICAPGAEVAINVPHPRHDAFLGDPTHVRPVTPQMLSLFDRELNDEWKRTGASNTPLGHYLGVDFKITAVETVVVEGVANQLCAGQISEQQVNEAIHTRWNIAEEFKIKLLVRK